MRCEALVLNEYRSLPCIKEAVLEHNGKYYCKTHHPPTVEAKQKKKMDKWRTKQKESEKAHEDRIKYNHLSMKALDYMRSSLPETVAEWEKEYDEANR